jgi:carboxypeptidase Q
VRVTTLEELDALGRAGVAGKIVLLDALFDKRMAAQARGIAAYQQAGIYRRDGPAAAARLGAVAALVRSVGGAEYRLPHTGQTNFPSDTPKIPAAAVAAEDAELIAALLREGPVAMNLVLTATTVVRCCKSQRDRGPKRK